MLTREQIEFYNKNGYLLVEDAVSPERLQALRDLTYDFIERSRAVSQSDELYDIDEGHSPARPKLTRIKLPHERHPLYWETVKSERISGILASLLGPDVLLQTSKLNTKAPGGGAAVEWHQDWAFYPHTNDDLCAVGVMMDDCAIENGPLLCIPGTHKGPVYDHHADGHFCGAIDPIGSDIAFDKAVPCIGPAGSISIHHARTIHGSALNTSDKLRRLLLVQDRAADAWPLCASNQMDWDAWPALMLTGETDPITPRLADVPVRLPLPPAKSQGSIYENQRGLKANFFGKVDTRAA